MSQPSDHDMTAVREAIDHYSDGDVERPQEIVVELPRVIPKSTNV